MKHRNHDRHVLDYGRSILERHLANGVIRLCPGQAFDEYVGVASDGTEVSIGTVFAGDVESATSMYSYLAAFPFPSNW